MANEQDNEQTDPLAMPRAPLLYHTPGMDMVATTTPAHARSSATRSPSSVSVWDRKRIGNERSPRLTNPGAARNHH
jgi:hypothetical protein